MYEKTQYLSNIFDKTKYFYLQYESNDNLYLFNYTNRFKI